jgi:predicted AAA+ superfamily ATPase
MLDSNRPEFAVVYGRRRVGKTYLIREYYDDDFTFYMTGVAKKSSKVQLDYFNRAVKKYGKKTHPRAGNWRDAFEILIELLESSRRSDKKIVFFDELPWIDTHRSGFLTALEHFWNSWASRRPDVLLIVCGSAASWMVKNLLEDNGGLHNRVTRRIELSPFSLAECEEYFRYNDIDMERKYIAESYMIFGGVPFYLSLFDRELSLAQNVDLLCFRKNAPLRKEFDELFSSLFANSERYMDVVSALASKKKGLRRGEIAALTNLKSGGLLTEILKGLEFSGFIRKYKDYSANIEKGYYQLTDFFTLFYIKYMGEASRADEHFWVNNIDNAERRAWTGYAFERLGMYHIGQIKNGLGISGVSTNTYTWRSRKSDPGAQIDMIIERHDGVTNLCEMKYSGEIFTIDKEYNEKLNHKKTVFIKETKTRNAVHNTLITTYGLSNNKYRNTIQSVITLEDLFR